MYDAHVSRRELMLLTGATMKLVDAGHLPNSWQRSGDVWYCSCGACHRWAWIDSMRSIPGGVALMVPCPEAPSEEELEPQDDVVPLTPKHDALVLAGLAVMVALLGIAVYEVINAIHVGLW